MESWTEIRCPACVQLGYVSPRLLCQIKGKPPKDMILYFPCSKCRSIVEFHFDKLRFVVLRNGEPRKKAKIAFE
jgi:hypothetical protein